MPGRNFTYPYFFLATLAVEKLHVDYELEVHWRAFQIRPPGTTTV